MAVTNTPAFPQTPKGGHVTVVNADGTGNKTVITAGSNGSKVVALMAASNDSAAHDSVVSIVRGGTTYVLGVVNVPAGAGASSGVPCTDLLAGLVGLPLDADGQKYLFLESGDTLVVSMAVAVTAAKTLYLNAVYADF